MSRLLSLIVYGMVVVLVSSWILPEPGARGPELCPTGLAMRLIDQASGEARLFSRHVCLRWLTPSKADAVTGSEDLCQLRDEVALPLVLDMNASEPPA